MILRYSTNKTNEEMNGSYVCTPLIYLLFHDFSVKPPNILFTLFTMVTVGPLSSHLA